MRSSLVALILALVPSLSNAIGVAPEYWPPLGGGTFSGPPQPFSPDPLVQYVWPFPSTDDTVLQYFELSAESAGGSPAASFLNTSSAVGSIACGIHVVGAGLLTIDFGVEFAGWVEFDSPDLADGSGIVVGIGEYTAVDYVGGFKQDTPKTYGSSCGSSTCTFRLETSPVGPELYEGVRYAFIMVIDASKNFTITAIRGVAQAKPVNYVGSFSSAGDPLLETVFYTAAYTVRATLQGDYMGSILMNRGDRFSWTGDAHPTQAASMATFANFPFIFNNLNRTKGDCQGIATYCLYFVLSVADYFDASGDAAGVAYLAPSVINHLDDASNSWANPEGLRFVGWDDRTGSGFANNTTPETQNLYRLLAIRSWAAAAVFLNATGSSAAASKYAALAVQRTADIRAMGGTPWYGSFGLHAGADAVNAGFLTPVEAAGIAAGALSDIVKLPSQSNFNQYFILQALGSLGQLDRAVESIRVIWGAVVQADATTFWETSHPSVADIMPPGPAPPAAEQSGWVSFCHPWASGPTPWLHKWVLGVRPLAPGFGHVLVAPHIAHSMHGVAGTVGTPHGVIALNASRGGNVSVRLPAGVLSATLQLSAVTLARLLGFSGADALDFASLELFDTVTGAIVPSRVVSALADTPLVDESDLGRGRSAALVAELTGGRAHSLRVIAQGGAQTLPPWTQLGSPFPPASWPGTFVGSDTKTGGSWDGVYGADGYSFFAYDVPSAKGNDPFCGEEDEGNTLSLECVEAGATVASIVFASYGTPTGSCPNFSAGSCAAPNSLATVQAACVGKHACSIDVSNEVFGGDPCAGTSKRLRVVAHCSAGGGVQPGSNTPPSDRTVLPPYVASVRVVDYDGYCGSSASWTNATSDVRALSDPSDASRRALGLTQPCGCPTSPVDIQLTDAAIAAGTRFRLSLYFVDFAPAPKCGALDGTNRTQEVYLLTGYPDLSPVAPRQYLSDFSSGMWLSFEVAGNIRVRISTIRGDFAALSAVAFDPVA